MKSVCCHVVLPAVLLGITLLDGRPMRAEDPAPAPPVPRSASIGADSIEPQANVEAPSAPGDELTPEAQQAAQTLRAQLSADSEAILMLDDILQGKVLGPEDGWFRVALSQTRYDWKTVASRYDGNADGKIDNQEFGGWEKDFQRLDRDRDGAVTESDLQWKAHALAPTPGALLFRHADRDGNGKVSQDEFLQFFQDLDADATGFVSLDDMRAKLQMPGDADPKNRPDYPNRSTLVLGLARQEVGSLQPGPALNEPAPDFTLQSLDGSSVTLSNEIGNQPVVLIFGNFTCSPFRSHAGNLEKLYRNYRDRARFLLVYVREAHPNDGWWSMNNRRVGIDLAQPTSDAQRCEVAGRCRDYLQLDLPFLVDNVNDTVGATYSGMPNRFYLIDREGRVAFKSGRGPFGFKPGELEQALIWLLATDGFSTSNS